MLTLSSYYILVKTVLDYIRPNHIICKKAKPDCSRIASLFYTLAKQVLVEIIYSSATPNRIIDRMGEISKGW